MRLIRWPTYSPRDDLIDQHHIPVRVAAHHAEEAGELRLEEAAVESELAALINDGLRYGRFLFSPLELPSLTSSDGSVAASRNPVGCSASGRLHGIDGFGGGAFRGGLGRGRPGFLHGRQLGGHGQEDDRPD